MLYHILSHSILRGMQEKEVESYSTLLPQCHRLPKAPSTAAEVQSNTETADV